MPIEQEHWKTVLSSETFWSGVMASVVAAAIVAVAVYIFRNSIAALNDRRGRVKEEESVL